MKILHIITSLGSGGAERMLSKLVEKDSENKHVIVTLLKSKVHYDIENTKVISLNYSNNNINKLLILFNLRKVIRVENPDIIQTWMKSNYYGTLIKLIFPNIKIVSNFRNGYNQKIGSLKIKFLNRLNENFDGHIFVSESALKERIDKGLKFSNYMVINNGFEIPEVKDKDQSTLNEKFIIGHMGRFHPVKNQKNIVKAFNKFSANKDVKLLLAGKNLSYFNLGFEEKQNKKIEFLGEIKNTDDFYKSIDVFILASKSEGFPNVIGEAMSHGVPIIATNAGESFDILGDTGYKLSNGSIEEINKSLEYVFYNRENLSDTGRKSRERIDNYYRIDVIVKKYINYYKRIGESL